MMIKKVQLVRKSMMSMRSHLSASSGGEDEGPTRSPSAEGVYRPPERGEMEKCSTDRNAPLQASCGPKSIFQGRCAVHREGAGRRAGTFSSRGGCRQPLRSPG